MKDLLTHEETFLFEDVLPGKELAAGGSEKQTNEADGTNGNQVTK